MAQRAAMRSAASVFDEHPDLPATLRPGSAGPAAVASVTLALLMFPIAFNLGAYGEVLYPDVFRVLVASFALLLISLRFPTYTPTRMWVTRLVLASPTAWFVVASIVWGSTADAQENPLMAAWLAVTLVISIPVTLRLLIDMFTPQVTAGRDRRLGLWMGGVVVAVVALGFLAGTFNERLMTCDDFAVAGSAEPAGCAR